MDYRFFGEQASLDAARKAADSIVERWSAEPDKVPGGGESTDGSGRQLSGTIGQPIAGMSTASNGTILVGGFQTMRAPRGPTAARRWQHY